MWPSSLDFVCGILGGRARQISPKVNVRFRDERASKELSLRACSLRGSLGRLPAGRDKDLRASCAV